MTASMSNGNGRRGFPWRALCWGGAAGLLLLPLVAMRYTTEVNWTVGDFIFAALLIGVIGVTFELTVRVTRSWTHRTAVGFALAAALFTVWVNGAVGMIGDEDNPYNLLFLGVIVLALVGSVAARFRPAGMAAAMGIAAIAHIAIAVGGMSTDPRGGIFSIAFAGLWLLSAALFWKASKTGDKAPDA